MKVSKRIRKGETVLYNITSDEELIYFINNVVQPKVKWIGIGKVLREVTAPMYNSDDTLSYKKWYTTMWGSQVKPYANQRQLVYWLARGYSDIESQEHLRRLQSKGGQSFSKAIKANPGQYKDINPTQLGWWIKKGYSKAEAIKLRAERQSTFSLEKCQKKFGEELGLVKFNERQDKWKKSRQNSKGVTWVDADKDCRSIGFFRKIDSDRCLILLAETYLTYSFIGESVIKSYSSIIEEEITTVDQLLTYIRQLPYNEMQQFAALSPIRDYLGMTKIAILEYWIGDKAEKFIKTMWGNLYYYKNYYFQSNGEFAIGCHLIQNNIEFTMHKRYPVDGVFMYDFYLTKYDMYIEYCGRDMISYQTKQNALGESGLDIFWESNIEVIIEKINELIEKIK